MVRRGWVQGVGRVRLAYLEFGGDGPAVLLLHGLLARATTWAETARWLTPCFRVVAIDQRGHGRSDAPQGPYDRSAYVGDAATAIERLGLGPALIVGHAMGALNAWALAAARPDLVRGLVLADMSASTMAGTPEADRADWLASWPVPFLSMAQAREFFAGHGDSWADYFMEVMVEGPDGYRPMSDPEHIARSRAHYVARDHWGELDRVRCPALVVKGAHSAAPRAELRGMADRLRHGSYAEIPDAGHVVHYDQPLGWRAVVEPFLLRVAGAAGESGLPASDA